MNKKNSKKGGGFFCDRKVCEALKKFDISEKNMSEKGFSNCVSTSSLKAKLPQLPKLSPLKLPKLSSLSPPKLPSLFTNKKALKNEVIEDTTNLMKKYYENNDIEEIKLTLRSIVEFFADKDNGKIKYNLPKTTNTNAPIKFILNIFKIEKYDHKTENETWHEELNQYHIMIDGMAGSSQIKFSTSTPKYIYTNSKILYVYQPLIKISIKDGEDIYINLLRHHVDKKGKIDLNDIINKSFFTSSEYKVNPITDDNLFEDDKNKTDLIKEGTLTCDISTFEKLKELQEELTKQNNVSEEGDTLGGKKHSKKDILGKSRCIYKIKGDRKEYVKHKGKLITVKDYKAMIKAKAKKPKTT